VTGPPQAEQFRVVAVGAVVVDDTQRVLLVRRARPPSIGVWTLPGGRVEAGESIEAAIVREVREETAIRTRIVCALGIVPIEREGFAYAIHEYLLVALDEPAVPHAGDDAAEARWTARGDMAALGVSPDVVKLVDGAMARALAEKASRRDGR
jgi:8-oxo-dGTP diphosphatase